MDLREGIRQAEMLAFPYDVFFSLLENCDKRAAVLNSDKLERIYRGTIGDDYSAMIDLLPEKGVGIYSAPWLAIKLLEKDKLVLSLVRENVQPSEFDKISQRLSRVKDGNLRTADCKFQWIDTLINENISSEKKKTVRSRFDRAATSKRWGKPIAIGMIVLGLICSMIIGFPLMGLFSALITAISVPLANWFLGIGAAPVVVSLLCGGVLTAVSFALQMASYVFGQRIMTIALSWVVPCGSTWGVVGLVSGTFFGCSAVLVVLSLFAVAFLHIFITYKIFGRSLNKDTDRSGLIMELPPYHKPHWKSLFGSVFNKLGSILKRALSIIIIISVIFWFLSYTPDGDVANSIIYRIGTFIEPVTKFFGLPWQLFVAFAVSAMGKEAALGVMGSLFNAGSIWAAIEQTSTVNTAALSTSMLAVISKPEALAFLFAFFFNMPCLMALAATAQEPHSMKWTVRIAAYYILSALILAFLVYHVGLIIF